MAQQPQKHPQEKKDRETIERLQKSGDTPKKVDLADLARLRIRYNGFPGAADIKASLDVLLGKWEMTEDELFAKTRELHAENIYQTSRQQNELEDWT
jgi:hypothetical protein